MFEFEIENKASGSKARTAKFHTAHGVIQTPIFMPVGTKATVKTVSSEDLLDLDAEIILANTYHLFLRPGEKLVKEMGQLHKWMNWNRPILTDSGGYQVFSLANKNRHKKDSKTGTKIDDNGVEFKSHLDGDKHYITPEQAIDIQTDLGADIIMAFDECAAADSSKNYFKSAMIRTHKWLERCKNRHQEIAAERPYPQALFGIVQGGVHEDLRIESAKFVDSQDLPGNAIGGLSVGETKKIMYDMTDICTDHLSENKPRYLMGVGKPEDLLECVDRGIDMFDCVHPTRISRHGCFWTLDGRMNIKNEQFKKDDKALCPESSPESLKNYSRSYIRHLFLENEMLAMRLMTVHNLHFLLELMRKIRQAINEDRFKDFKDSFLKRYKT